MFSMGITCNDLLNSIAVLNNNEFSCKDTSSFSYYRNCTRVVCCPIWLCLLWSVLINFVGIVLCFQKIAGCHHNTDSFIARSMKLYRVAPEHKHFIDNMQWYMKCCGVIYYQPSFLNKLLHCIVKNIFNCPLGRITCAVCVFISRMDLYGIDNQWSYRISEVAKKSSINFWKP